MSSFLLILVIGISLSMDAFSLALVYGISGITSKQKKYLSTIVGTYHFVMPLIGLTFGSLLSKINIISIDIIAFIILIYIGIDLILSNFREGESLKISKIGFLIFGLSVSIDSLSVGVSLRAITDKFILSAVTFSLTSLLFTYIGLTLGNIIGHKVGQYSRIVGGIILIVIALVLFIK